MTAPFLRSRGSPVVSFASTLTIPLGSNGADDCILLYIEGADASGGNEGAPGLPSWFTTLQTVGPTGTGFKIVAYGRVPAAGAGTGIALKAGAGQTVSGGWWGWADVVSGVGWKSNGWLDVPVTAANFGSYTRADVSAPTIFSLAVQVGLDALGAQTFVGWNTGDAGIGLNSSNRPIVFIKNTLGNSIGNVAANADIPNLTANETIWIRGDINISTGSISYFYSRDPGAHASSVLSHWTQLGTAVAGTNGGTTPRVSNSDTVIFGVTPNMRIFSFIESLTSGTNSLEVNFSDPLPGSFTLTGADIRHLRPTADNLPGGIPFEYWRACSSGSCYADPTAISIPSVSVYGTDRLALISWHGTATTAHIINPLSGPSDWDSYEDRAATALKNRYKVVTRTKEVGASFADLPVDLAASSPYTWYYYEFVFTGLAVAAIPPASPQPPVLRLGCADSYGVFITDNSYDTVIDQVHWSDLQWERVLDDISQAKATIPDEYGGVNCVAHLGGLLPLAYGLRIERNENLVWRGPIVSVGRQGDAITVNAADVFMRYQKRFLLRRVQKRVDFDGDAAVLFRNILITHAAQPTDSWNLPVPTVMSGVSVQRALKPREFKMAWDLMAQLLQAAVDAYIMNGVLYMWDPEKGWCYRGAGPPIGVGVGVGLGPAPVTRVLDGPYNSTFDLVYGTFSESSFSVRPNWTLDGAGTANFVVVPAADSGQEGFRAYEYAESVTSQGIFGLLDAIETDPPELPQDAEPAEVASAGRARARSAVALRGFPPLAVEGGTLSEDAPVDVDNLRPGSLWKLDIYDEGYGQLLTLGRLRRVTVAVRRDATGITETVTPMLEPPGQEGQL